MRNVVLRWAEDEEPNKQSEPVKHLKYFPDHQFEWKVLTRATEYTIHNFLNKSINPFLNNS